MADKTSWSAVEKFQADPLCDSEADAKQWKKAQKEADLVADRNRLKARRGARVRVSGGGAMATAAPVTRGAAVAAALATAVAMEVAATEVAATEEVTVGTWWRALGRRRRGLRRPGGLGGQQVLSGGVELECCCSPR